MFRLAYRDFGDHESLVVNHTVKGGPLGAERWYELRNPSAAFVYQQDTIVDASTNYWLGSIAMDKVGNTALGFSASSKNLFLASLVVFLSCREVDLGDRRRFMLLFQFSFPAQLGKFSVNRCFPHLL